MQFLIIAHDGADSEAAARRANVRQMHLENMKKVMEYGTVLSAGGITNTAGSAVGSYLVMEFETRELLDYYLENEPYIINKVWQDIKIETINVVIMNNEKIGR